MNLGGHGTRIWRVLRVGRRRYALPLEDVFEVVAHLDEERPGRLATLGHVEHSLHQERELGLDTGLTLSAG